MFNTYLNRWNLIADGTPIITHSSQLFPVVAVEHGVKAMLKLTNDEDERTVGGLMNWWAGEGAANVLAYEDGALLTERATGSASLSDMSRSGQDDQACRIICRVASRLHARRESPLPALTPVSDWFRALPPAAKTHGGILLHCAKAANKLLSSPGEIVTLHGDLHHGNVLDFGASGWLAIDPKGLIGERGFDYANIFTNPDLANPNPAVAIEPERFAQRIKIVTEAADLERERLLL